MFYKIFSKFKYNDLNVRMHTVVYLQQDPIARIIYGGVGFSGSVS